MIQLRKYTDDDREAMLACISKIRDELGWSPIGVKYASDLLDISGTYFVENGNFWVLLDDENIIGSCGLMDKGQNRGLLKRLYLDKDYRGRKLGKKLFQAAVDYAKSKDFKTLYLGTGYAAATAVLMYDKMGLTKIDSYPEGFGEYGDELLYKLELGK